LFWLASVTGAGFRVVSYTRLRAALMRGMMNTGLPA